MSKVHQLVSKVPYYNKVKMRFEKIQSEVVYSIYLICNSIVHHIHISTKPQTPIAWFCILSLISWHICWHMYKGVSVFPLSFDCSAPPNMYVLFIEMDHLQQNNNQEGFWLLKISCCIQENKRYELDFRDRARLGVRIRTSVKNFQLTMEVLNCFGFQVILS